MFRFASSTLFGLALTLGLSGVAQAGNYCYSSQSYHAPATHYAPKYVPHASYPKTYVNVHTPYVPVYRPVPVIVTKPAYCCDGYCR